MEIQTEALDLSIVKPGPIRSSPSSPACEIDVATDENDELNNTLIIDVVTVDEEEDVSREVPDPVITYYNNQPIDYYDYLRMVHDKPQHTNESVVQASSQSTPSINYSAFKNKMRSDSEFSSFEMDAEEDNSLNKPSAVCNAKVGRPQSDDKKLLDVNDEVESITNHSLTQSSNVSFSPSIKKGLRDSPLTIRAKENLAAIERIEGSKFLQDKLIYHQNMVRDYPGVENRTPEEAEHRRRNTEAARLSRARTKAIEEQRDHIDKCQKRQIEKSMRKIATIAVHGNKLRRKLSRRQVDYFSIWEQEAKNRCNRRSPNQGRN